MAITDEDQVDGFEFASFLLFFIMIEKSGFFFFFFCVEKSGFGDDFYFFLMIEKCG